MLTTLAVRHAPSLFSYIDSMKIKQYLTPRIQPCHNHLFQNVLT